MCSQPPPYMDIKPVALGWTPHDELSVACSPLITKLRNHHAAAAVSDPNANRTPPPPLPSPTIAADTSALLLATMAGLSIPILSLILP